MTSLINDSLASSIWEQIVHEKYNANIYLYICGYLKNKGLDNLAKHFMEQHDEETEHSKLFFNLLTDLNTEVKILEVPGCNFNFNNVLDVAEAYLQREITTTNNIGEIKNLAIETNNHVVEEFCRTMLTKQQAEYEEATTWQDRANMTGGDWKFVMLWDIGEE